jgi:hypothetical protein
VAVGSLVGSSITALTACWLEKGSNTFLGNGIGSPRLPKDRDLIRARHRGLRSARRNGTGRCVYLVVAIAALGRAHWHRESGRTSSSEIGHIQALSGTPRPGTGTLADFPIYSDHPQPTGLHARPQNLCQRGQKFQSKFGARGATICLTQRAWLPQLGRRRCVIRVSAQGPDERLFPNSGGKRIGRRGRSAGGGSHTSLRVGSRTRPGGCARCPGLARTGHRPVALF